jgi:acyl-CoA synthetase (AMP-forming)/AMP-acid ligase II
MAGLLRGRARAYPRHFAVIDGKRRLTFAQLDEVTDRLASPIAGRGVQSGDRVALLMLENAAVFELAFAVAKLGAIVVPLNWRWVPPEVAHALNLCSPSLVFVSKRFQELLKDAPHDLSVVSLADEPQDANGQLCEFVGGSPRLPSADIPSDHPWLILFTSGTTGRAKGCVHATRSMVITAASTVAHAGLKPDDRFLLTMPLFHVFGLDMSIAHLSIGGGVVIARAGSDAGAIRRLIEEDRCTTLSLDGKRLNELMLMQEREPVALPLRRLIRGGGLQGFEEIQRCEQALNLEVILSYGQTEACGQSLYMRGSDQAAGPRAVGRPAIHLESRLANAEGDAVAIEEVGELLLRGPPVMLGYWNDPKSTDEAISGGWLHTGDSFQQDENGFLHFAGRLKELIKSGGENVYPAEVEQALLEHPGIVECAVAGVPHPRWGEAVKAFVVARMELTPVEVAQWCAGRIAGYKKPRFVEFVSEVPRNFLGKIDRRALGLLPVTADQQADADQVVRDGVKEAKLGKS